MCVGFAVGIFSSSYGPARHSSGNGSAGQKGSKGSQCLGLRVPGAGGLCRAISASCAAYTTITQLRLCGVVWGNRQVEHDRETPVPAVPTHSIVCTSLGHRLGLFHMGCT